MEKRKVRRFRLKRLSSKILASRSESFLTANDAKVIASINESTENRIKNKI